MRLIIMPTSRLVSLLGHLVKHCISEASSKVMTLLWGPTCISSRALLRGWGRPRTVLPSSLVRSLCRLASASQGIWTTYCLHWATAAAGMPNPSNATLQFVCVECEHLSESGSVSKYGHSVHGAPVLCCSITTHTLLLSQHTHSRSVQGSCPSYAAHHTHHRRGVPLQGMCTDAKASSSLPSSGSSSMLQPSNMAVICC